MYGIKRLLLTGGAPYDQIWKEKMLPFPVTKLGKREKKKGGGGGGEAFLHAVCTVRLELSHSLHSGHRVGLLSKQHD